MSVTTVISDIGSYQVVLLQDDHISNVIRSSGKPYEPTLVTVVRELTRRGNTILDVGANLGNHTLYWAKAGRHVIAFEPNPVTRLALTESVRLNRLDTFVDIYPIALGAETGSGTMRTLLEDNQGAVAVEPCATGEIPIVRLDDLDLANFSVMKIDVEGAEERVLRGAHETIVRLRPLIIAESLENKGGVVALLRELGYRRVPISLAFTPTYLYLPTFRSFLGLLRSHALIRRLIRRVALRLHLSLGG